MSNDMFIKLLSERCAKKRIDTDHLSLYSRELIKHFGESKDDPFLKEILDESMPVILRDCEIFINMSEAKAMDALSELANLACLYVKERGIIYYRICELIQRIRVSYPVQEYHT